MNSVLAAVSVIVVFVAGSSRSRLEQPTGCGKDPVLRGLNIGEAKSLFGDSSATYRDLRQFYGLPQLSRTSVVEVVDGTVCARIASLLYADRVARNPAASAFPISSVDSMYVARGGSTYVVWDRSERFHTVLVDTAVTRRIGIMH